MHGGDDVQFGTALVGKFLVDHGTRDDADHRGAGFEGGVGDDAHQADAAAAEDQTEPALAEQAPDIPGGLGVGGVVAGAGAAEDRDISRGGPG